MRKLRKLKLVHKKLLNENGYDHKKYLYERDTDKEIVFFNIDTKEILRFSKNQGLFC